MNKKLIFKILGIILGIEGVSLLIPFVIALVAGKIPPSSASRRCSASRSVCR